MQQNKTGWHKRDVKSMCKDCPDRKPCCWSSCERYKAECEKRKAKIKWLQSFNGAAAGNKSKIIRIAERKELKKRR